MRRELLLLTGILILGVWNVHLHWMVLTEGRITPNGGWDLHDIRDRRWFFLYDLLFAAGAALYLSTFLRGAAKVILLLYAFLHFLGHGYYICNWTSGEQTIESVLRWSVTHPAQRGLVDESWWNSFNWWGTAADLGLHATVAVLAAYFLIFSLRGKV